MTAYTQDDEILSSQVVEEVEQQDIMVEDDEAGSKPTAAAVAGDADSNGTLSCVGDVFRKFLAFYHANEFPFLVLLAIGLAKAYPPLGADYLQPQITAKWIAVVIIFLLSGLGMRSSEFGKVIYQKIPFHMFVQVYDFLVVSAVVFGVAKALLATGILHEALSNGMIICSCLSMSVNAVIVLTSAANGNEAAAIFHSALGNIVGIFLSPVLIVAFLPGASSNVNLAMVFLDLTYKVLIPLIIGQVLRLSLKTVREFYTRHKKCFKKAQEYSLVFIVYTVFCKTFEGGGSEASIGETFLMILFQCLLLVSLKVIAWYCLKLLFRDEPELRVMGVLGCVNKTVALGVPMITSIYKDDPNLGLYTLPLLIWYPLQLVVGSACVPRFAAFIASERERLESADKELTTTETASNNGRRLSDASDLDV